MDIGPQVVGSDKGQERYSIGIGPGLLDARQVEVVQVQNGMAKEEGQYGGSPLVADEGEILEVLRRDVGVLEHMGLGLMVEAQVGRGGRIEEAEDVCQHLGGEAGDGGHGGHGSDGSVLQNG